MPGKLNLDQFVRAQAAVYGDVLQELTAGHKQTHWIWFIFPQLTGLGSSQMSRRFGLASLADAQSYLAHPTLGPRLLECTRLVLTHAGRPIDTILPYPDDIKFRSSLTLFAAASPDEPLFQQALDAFFGGVSDSRTIELLGPERRDKDQA